MMKAAMIGKSPFKPIVLIVTLMPISCRAIYGMVATMPVIATASSSPREW